MLARVLEPQSAAAWHVQRAALVRHPLVVPVAYIVLLACGCSPHAPTTSAPIPAANMPLPQSLLHAMPHSQAPPCLTWLKHMAVMRSLLMLSVWMLLKSGSWCKSNSPLL
jgi:hypothetical protein